MPHAAAVGTELEGGRESGDAARGAGPDEAGAAGSTCPPVGLAGGTASRRIVRTVTARRIGRIPGSKPVP